MPILGDRELAGTDGFKRPRAIRPRGQAEKMTTGRTKVVGDGFGLA
jgi:hypothetical protein